MGVDEILPEIKNFKTILLDTNSIIYYLDDILPYSEIMEQIMSEVEIGHTQAHLSVISVSELLVKPIKEKDQNKLNQVMTFIHHFPNLKVNDVTEEISLQTAFIRATTGIKLPDAIIIATASINECAVIGNDSKWMVKDLPVSFFCLDDYT